MQECAKCKYIRANRSRHEPAICTCEDHAEHRHIHPAFGTFTYPDCHMLNTASKPCKFWEPKKSWWRTLVLSVENTPYALITRRMQKQLEEERKEKSDAND